MLQFCAVTSVSDSQWSFDITGMMGLPFTM